MKLKIESFFINVGIVIICYIVFIVFTSLSNLLNNNTLAKIGLAITYLISLFFLIRYFNKSIYNISVNQFIGKKHLIGIITSLVILFIVFAIPYFIISESKYIFSWKIELLESLLSNSIVAISEELVFRAFFFLSMIVVMRNHLLAAFLSSLAFATIHIFGIDNLVHFLWVFSASMIMSYIYYVTSSLISTIIFHLFLNVIISYAFVSPDQLENLLITQIITMSSLTFVILFLLNNKLNNCIH